jgi:type IV secretory pathway VirJ component
MAFRPRDWALVIGLTFVLLAQGGCATAPPGASPMMADRLASLPLVLVPSDRSDGDTMVVLYSGDNGWAEQVREIASRMAADGTAVVGVSAVRYFLQRKTADQAAADLTAIIDHFGDTWNRKQVILVGYSFGGDALPLIAEHLPAATLARVRLVALISPSDHGDLAFRGVSWFDWRWPGDKPLEPALRALAGRPMVCLYAEHDPRAACRRFPADLIRPIMLPGGHHYDSRHAVVADTIIGSAGLPVASPAP